MAADSRIIKQPFYRLDPFNFTHNVWGGHWLEKWKNHPQTLKFPIGEAWEFSTHADRPSHVKTPQGRLLLQSILKKPSPFLLKFIDAQDNLSLQVHPDDIYAQNHENDSGKTESWVIMDVGNKPHDGIIYLGFKPQLRRHFKSDQEIRKSFFKAIHDRDHAVSFLNKIKVKPGDVYEIKPGTVHAIGHGIRLFEIQQTSNLTYRVWDWNRYPPRTLHLRESYDVINFKPQPITAFRHQSFPISCDGEGSFQETNLLTEDRQRFAVNEILLKGKKSRIYDHSIKPFYVLTVIQGTIKVYRQNEYLGLLREGTSAYFPTSTKNICLESNSDCAQIFKSYAPH